MGMPAINGEPLTVSPLPFGVHCVPDEIRIHKPARADASPLPFGVHCVPDIETQNKMKKYIVVSIAFRRSLRSRQMETSSFPTGENIVSIAFRRSLRSRPIIFTAGCPTEPSCLHCLSAFTAFPTRLLLPGAGGTAPCLHCLSAFTAFPTRPRGVGDDGPREVSIAFRRSLRSRLRAA